MKEVQKGKHVTEFAMVQVNVPKAMFEKVRRKCEYEGFSMTAYHRKWWIEGFKRAEDKGEL